MKQSESNRNNNNEWITKAKEANLVKTGGKAVTIWIELTMTMTMTTRVGIN
jgi:hypothetical protein